MIISVAIGGALGAVIRYFLGIIINRYKTRVKVPIAMLIVNMLGSFGLGLFLSIHTNAAPSNTISSLIGIGFFGALTTFSTFSMETIQLLSQNKKLIALKYILYTVLGCILSFLLGNLVSLL